MERALRAPPDVVRSAIAPQRYAENTIDQLLAAPQKIVIPERYIPEKVGRIWILISILTLSLQNTRSLLTFKKKTMGHEHDLGDRFYLYQIKYVIELLAFTVTRTITRGTTETPRES